MKLSLTPALLLFAGCTIVHSRAADLCEPTPSLAGEQETPPTLPRLDHHQHLFSEGAREVTARWVRTIDTSYARQVEREPLVDADQLVHLLDEAGIPKALVLSSAYFFSRWDAEQPGEYEEVMAENDWTLAQVRRYPDRLYAACGVNPRRSHAVAEIERCAASGGFRALKLHFDASGVEVTKAEHVAAVRQAFATANRLRLPIAVHIQSEAGSFGARQARIFLDEIMPAAPDVPVTVLHLWGGGLYLRGPAEALAVFAESFERDHPSTRDLWFDLGQASMMVRRYRDREELAERMRQIGLARMLYGSDGPQWSGVPPKRHWEGFRGCMPLTRAEFDSIATNVARYLQ